MSVNANGFKYFLSDINIYVVAKYFTLFSGVATLIEITGLSVFDKIKVLLSQEINREYPPSQGHSSKQIKSY